MRPWLASLVVFALPTAAFAQQTPEARVLSLRGGVDVTPAGAATPQPSRVGDVLARNARVHTAADGIARLTLPNGVVLTVLPESDLTLFASPDAPLPGQPPSTATTLSSGAVRFTAAPDDAAVLPLACGATSVDLGTSDGALNAPRGAVFVRISTYRGRMLVRTGAHRRLRGGQGVRESMRPPRTTVVPLTPAPTWSAPPPARVTSLNGDGTVSLAFASGAGPAVRLSGWRAELAHDAAFTDLVSSERIAARTPRWNAHFQGAGEWYARVFPIDSQGIEGLPSASAHFTVESPEIVPGAEATADAPARPATLRVPAGIFCGLDGGPLTESSTPVRLAPARAHTVRCASAPDGHDAQVFSLAARDAGPLRHDARIEDTGGEHRLLQLRLADLEGHPLPYATITATVPDDVELGPIREGSERGVYTASIRWRSQRTHIPMRLTLNREVIVELDVPTAAPLR